MVGSLLLQSILIIAGSSLGACQVNLTRTPSVACENEVVNYTCIVGGAQVQWIVEPFISASGVTLFIASNDDETLNTVLRDDGIVQIRHVSNNPFTTVLTINSNSIVQRTDFVCIAFSVRASLTFNVGEDEDVLPAPNLNFMPMAEEDIFLVSWDQSPSSGIERYVINCTGDGFCENAVVGSSSTLNAAISANSSNEGRSYNLSFTAENRCGFRSPAVSVNLELRAIPTISTNCTNVTVINGVSRGYLIATYVLIAVVVVLVIIVVILLITIFCCEMQTISCCKMTIFCCKMQTIFCCKKQCKDPKSEVEVPMTSQNKQ